MCERPVLFHQRRVVRSNQRELLYHVVPRAKGYHNNKGGSVASNARKVLFSRMRRDCFDMEQTLKPPTSYGTGRRLASPLRSIPKISIHDLCAQNVNGAMASLFSRLLFLVFSLVLLFLVPLLPAMAPSRDHQSTSLCRMGSKLEKHTPSRA